jgi:hypothetical protein
MEPDLLVAENPAKNLSMAFRLLIDGAYIMIYMQFCVEISK